jgi:hypothetical protein
LNNGKFRTFRNTCALLILISNKTDSNYQSGDCINAALKLLSFIITSKERAIDFYKPAALETFKRKHMVKLQAGARKEGTERVILEAYSFLCENGEQHKKNLQEIISLNTGKSQATVSKTLKKYGLSKKEKKNLS